MIAKLEFLEMQRLIEIEDYARRYEIILPLQPSDKYTISKEDVEKEEPKYGKLIFIVAGNERFGYFKGEPVIKLIFSHFDVPPK